MILEPDSDGDDDGDGDDDDVCGDDDHGDDRPVPAAGSTTPVSTIPRLPLAPNVADANIASTSDVEYKLASNDVAESSKLALDRQVAPRVPGPREGWYVAFHAVLPGVYFGV